MQQALDLAAHAERCGEVPVGAVLVQDNNVIGAGWNQPITHHDPSAHAEMVALRAAAKSEKNYRLTNARLYVTLEPCAMCAGALLHARIDEVIFATRDPRAGAVVSVLSLFDNDNFNHQIAWREGLLADAASEQLKAFFKARR